MFRVPQAWSRDFSKAVKSSHVDSTFELQIRSINSEAWLELDHDYLYKNKESSDSESLKIFFDTIASNYENIEQNILNTYNDLSEKAKENNDLLNFMKYKFRLRLKNIETITEIQLKNESVNLLSLLSKSNRDTVLERIIEANYPSLITVEDILNECCELNGKERFFDSNNESDRSRQSIGHHFQNFNPKLGTCHDEYFDNYEEFRNEIDIMPFFDDE